MEIEFAEIGDVDQSEFIDLMNDKLVRKHMPLFDDVFAEKDYHEFISAKRALWREHGFGPWAFLVDGNFAGWGGLQAEDGYADLALVLSPKFWGTGKAIFDKIVKVALEEMKLEELTILLPLSRIRSKGLHRLGFVVDGEVYLEGQRFVRFRFGLKK